MKKTLRILGTRGIPASHGGFETFAEYLSLHLVKHGWDITVYCQKDGTGEIYNDEWRGVRRVNIPINKAGAIGTIIFDWKSTLHASNSDSLILTLGYNTALFSLLYRIKNNINIMNMDGIEWKRNKWSIPERIWLYINERAGCYLANHLIADHPEIKNHLKSRVNEKKITMIPYGSEEIKSASIEQLEPFGLEPSKYAIVIARPEPENSILEIVTAFSSKKRGIKLVVLGNFDKANPEYSTKVKKAASNEVIFPGAIYDKSCVNTLRFYALLYIHGHQVGGTNPSLVEALGAGNAVLAHDNIFNRWVAGDTNHYFSSTQSCQQELDFLLENKQRIVEMRNASTAIHNNRFTWLEVLNNYEELLRQYA
jgi:glycosyltransferase involved in cell wall biosynthesis